MDVLSDVLQSIQPESTVHCRAELTAPWGFEVPESENAAFHVVLEGSCRLEFEGLRAPIRLGPGDLVVLPHGAAHTLRDESGSSVLSLQSLLEGSAPAVGCSQVRHGGGGIATVLVCGCFRFAERATNPLLAALPPVVHLRGEDGHSVQWLETTLQFIANEAVSGRPGAETVIARLADVLFIHAVRGTMARLPTESRGWLRALAEPTLARALQRIHARPRHPWTVAQLASEVGMSRSAFSARFTELVGEPPLQYVTRWRMQRASALLRDGQCSLGEVAGQVGYESEAAFAKAFKRWMGVPPGAYRRSSRLVELKAAS